MHPFVSISIAKSTENAEDLTQLELEICCVGGFLYNWVRTQIL